MFAAPMMMKRAAAGGGTITFVGYAVATGSGAAPPVVSLTSLTGGIGTAALAGDLVVAYQHQAAAFSAADNGISTAGYTIVADLWEPGTSFRRSGLEVGIKRMGVTPDTQVGFFGTGTGTHGSTAGVLVFRGVHATTPQDVAATTATGTGTTTSNPPAITPVTTGAVIVAMGGGGSTSSANELFSSDLTGFVWTGQPNTVASSSGMGRKAWTGGSFDPAAWTGGSQTGVNTWAAATLALRPA